MLEELKVRVDTFWSKRIRDGDPLQAKLQTERVGGFKNAEGCICVCQGRESGGRFCRITSRSY